MVDEYIRINEKGNINLGDRHEFFDNGYKDEKADEDTANKNTSHNTTITHAISAL